jgi:hypothetical protein
MPLSEVETSFTRPPIVICEISGQTAQPFTGIVTGSASLNVSEQSLILATDCCIGRKLLAHALLPSLRLVHFVRQ